MQPTNIKQLSTKAYHLFLMDDTNRVLQDENGFVPRKDLLATMRAEGFWKIAPITCYQDGRFFRIIDGHNRFVTAKFLGLPVEYIAYPSPKIDDCTVSPIVFSVTQKRWSGDDVAAGYAKQGKDDYAEVLEYAMSLGISTKAAFSLFSGQYALSSNTAPDVRSGTFRIRDRELPKRVAEVYSRVVAAVPQVAGLKFFAAINRCLFVEAFRPSRLFRRVEANPTLLHKCMTVDAYIDNLESAYNFKQPYAERLLLSVEVQRVMRARSVCDKAVADSKRAITRVREVAERALVH